MTNEQLRWLLKVIQPERTLASLPGGSGLGSDICASLLDVPEDVYTSELARMRQEASDAAHELPADPAVAAMVDRLPLDVGAKVAMLGDSLTSDPQSWAVILEEMLTTRRGDDGITLTIHAVGGETTTHALVRVAEAIGAQPDWLIVLLGTNDARTQGPHPTKTLVHHEETRRNVAELRRRLSSETTASAIWITPPAVDEEKVAAHWGLARFGVRFRNEDMERIANIIRDGGGPVIDAFSLLGAPPTADVLLGDGLHLTVEVRSVWLWRCSAAGAPSAETTRRSRRRRDGARGPRRARRRSRARPRSRRAGWPASGCRTRHTPCAARGGGDRAPGRSPAR